MLDIGRGYDGWVGWDEGMVLERRQEHGPYLYSLSYLATQCINNMNRITKCRFTLRRILLCKWSVKMRGNCWYRCHVYMISKHLIQKYIHVCLPDNWNTPNHQSKESPQNTQTHTVHWNTQTSQPIETPKLPRQLIHPNRPAQGSTQTAQYTEIPWSNPLKHTTHLVHWNTLLLHHPLGFYSMKQTISTVYPPPPNRTKTTTHAKKRTPQKLNGFQWGSLAGRQPPPPPSFLPFCYATSKTFEWHFAGRLMAPRHCVLAWIGYVHVLYRHLKTLHWYAFLVFVKH